METMINTLPELGRLYEISDDQAQEFTRNGHTQTLNLLDVDEALAYRNVISGCAG